ncbi:hypothetical protein D0Z07_5643 [Hyphodiscus hymeniophilus]|uniref:Uncharacterized protein n=1 Tax=Hyphodiscus hymeniophilus TaxID=353542 RepID=A0A9P7AW82_9HELO|nr:hypothetical protein D0Z07_5643 [Hyphodiscus hymeniophilus]
MIMASEEQEMLLKISQLAGQINRHKNGQPPDHQTVPAPVSSNFNTRGSMRSSHEANEGATDWNKDYSNRRGNRGAYPSRGFARGGRQAPIHRHRTLVLSGNTPASATLSENASPAGDDGTTTTASAPGWVAKTGRHLQLINTSIYEKDTQTRAKAMEETRKQKLKQRDDREKAKLHKHIQRLAAGNIGATGATPTAANYEIEVQGIRFRVTKNGSKLAKVPGEGFDQGYQQDIRWSSQFTGDPSSAKSTPKIAVVGGVRFYRTKNGNMYRSGIIKAYHIMRTTAEEEDADMSSDEDDEEIDGEDVDSDDLDGEFLGDDGATVDSDVPMQRDYVQFS